MIRVIALTTLMVATSGFLGAATEPTVLVLTTGHIKHAPSRGHVVELIRETALQLGAGDAELPHVIFIYLPLGAAQVERLGDEVALYVQAVGQQAGPIYEIWIMGDTSDQRTALGIATALNMWLKLGLSEGELRTARDQVCRRSVNQVSIEALRAHR